MPGDILFDREAIQHCVKQLAFDLTQEYNGRELVLIGILDGCFIFLSDLVRLLPLSIQIGFLCAKSYVGTESNAAELKIHKDFNFDLGNKNVVVVDTILDSGNTLYHALPILTQDKPASLKSCVLIDKTCRRQWSIEADYKGFTLNQDAFLVGYGLDYNGHYRNLAHISVLTDNVAKGLISHG